MQFANPSFLWALLAVSIPIIVHLFHFQKHRKVYFTNVDLLKELNVQKRNLSILRQLIILTLRILSIIAIVFTFANPFIKRDNSTNFGNSNLVNIYIDNSASMEIMNNEISALESAKNRAKQIVYLYGDNSIYRIFSNGTPVYQPLLNKNEAIACIDEVNATFKQKSTASIISSFNAVDDRVKDFNVINYYISDIQRNTFDTTSVKNIQNHSCLIPISNVSSSNLNVEDVVFESQVNTISSLHEINVLIANESEEDFNKIPVNLHISNKLVSTSTFDFKANSSSKIQLFFPDDEIGVKHGFAEVSDNSIVFDNKFYFTYKIEDKIKILDIYNDKPNDYISILYESDSLFEFTAVNDKQLRYNELSRYDLVILDNLETIPSGMANQIAEAVKDGTNCLILPGENIDIGTYNFMLKSVEFGEISAKTTTDDRNMSFDFKSDYFSGMFSKLPDLKKDNLELPVVEQYYPINLKDGISLMKLTDHQSSILSYKMSGLGNVFLFSTLFDSDYSDLHLNTLFVPMMYKISFWGKHSMSSNYSPSQKVIPLTINVKEVHGLELVCLEDSTFKDYSFITIKDRLYVKVENAELPAGNYSVMEDGVVVDGFSVNNDRTESSLDFYTIDELKSLESDELTIVQASDKDFLTTLNDAVTNKELWKLFLLISITLLVIEMILLRFWEGKM